MPHVWSQPWMLHPPPHPYWPQSSTGSLELHPPKSLQLSVPQPDVQVAVAVALDPKVEKQSSVTCKRGSGGQVR
jgi:hypothetical protein